jgi:FtsZ-binding cell division protein ZapB
MEQQHTNKTMSDTHDVIISGFDLDRLERELAEANHQIQKYAAEARQAIDAHGAAFVELAAVKQTMGELCESCGWAMRFPGQPCRCELERELVAAKDALLKAHKDYGCELRDPNGTIWEHAAKVQQQRDRLERELLDLKESIASLSHPNCRDLLRELAEANEYADKLAAGYPDGMLPKDIEVLRDANYEFAQEVHGLREQRDVIMQRLSETHMRMTEAEQQRDRLAQALRELWNNHTLHGAAYELIEEALAAAKLQIRNHIEK